MLAEITTITETRKTTIKQGQRRDSGQRNQVSTLGGNQREE